MQLAHWTAPERGRLDELQTLFMDEKTLYAADADGAAVVGTFAPPMCPPRRGGMGHDREPS
jgi:hypothetical protein